MDIRMMGWDCDSILIMNPAMIMDILEEELNNHAWTVAAVMQTAGWLWLFMSCLLRR